MQGECGRDVCVLWRCVLFKALSDLKSCAFHPEEAEARDEAEAWLNLRSSDFRDVCELAGYSPERVYEAGQKLVAMRKRRQNGALLDELARDNPQMIEFFTRAKPRIPQAPVRPKILRLHVAA
ncbi:MAG: hypothetical protein ABW189_01485 [Rickettsiales bacterium]